MARIALVQCPLWDVTVPPSGIASLSSYLKMKGHQVTMFDFNVELYQENKDYFEPFLSGVSNQPGLLQMWEETEAFRENPVVTERTLKCWTERILAFEPDLVGFSAYNTTIHTCLHIARQLKEEHKDITIVFGGASCFQEHYTRAILSTGAVDAIVRGEGEIAFDRIAQAQEPSFCPGTILFMDGRHVDCGDAELVQNLDAIPFPILRACLSKATSTRVNSCQSRLAGAASPSAHSAWKQITGRYSAREAPRTCSRSSCETTIDLVLSRTGSAIHSSTPT